MFERCFCLKQRWFRAGSLWKSFVQLLSVLNFLFLNSAVSERIRTDRLWNKTDRRSCFLCSMSQRWKTAKIWSSAVQRWLSMGRQHGLFDRCDPEWINEMAGRYDFFPMSKKHLIQIQFQKIRHLNQAISKIGPKCANATLSCLCIISHLNYYLGKVLLPTFMGQDAKLIFGFYLREVSSGSESTELRDRQTKNFTAGWGSFWERSPERFRRVCISVGSRENSLT